jgi:4-amino-4-deoxy-L-arabinose transferase-like glycosyltransferase
MKMIKRSKENIFLALIAILSAILNFANLGIEGTANSYYAAAAKSMTLSLKNFFFVSFDPAGFVSIDKPPLGFWFQALSAKIFGYHGWSIILPQAIAGFISVIILYIIVKRSFGSAAGLISALCLAITPVFVAVSRNNSVDNILVLFLLLACWALSIAAEKGKLKYLIIAAVMVGLGFNVKMLQAYMIAPALYVTYLFATSVSIKKRILHLVLATVILVAVSLSWAIIVDLTPASNRPYVDSSTNNTVLELIVGHNGLERLGLSSSSNGGGMGSSKKMAGAPPSNFNSKNFSNKSSKSNNQNMPGNPPSNSSSQGMQGNPGGNPPSGFGKIGSGGPNMQGNHANGGNMGGSGSSNLSGTFGAQTTAGVTRLFSKNILSDQIIWFLPLALFGFIAAAIKENLRFRLDNKEKQALVLWFTWLAPVFIYFSYTTGTFHSYYLTMLAPPIAALTGIGITSMWELCKEGTWKSCFLPIALIANGAIQMLMFSYFLDSSNIVKVLMGIVITLCFGSSLMLIVLNIMRIKAEKKQASDSDNIYGKNNNIKLKKTLTTLAMAGLMAAPFVGSSTVLFNKLNGSFPAAGLELLSNSKSGVFANSNTGKDNQNNANSKLIKFLLKNKTKKQKYLLVVSNSNSASEIIIQTGESVMALGGFLGNNNPITLKQFKALVKKGEIRYVMAGGQGGQGGTGSNSQIMNWVKRVGKSVSSSKYSDNNKIFPTLVKLTQKQITLKKMLPMINLLLVQVVR